eukprot:6530876-Prymnesium_polylepis.1
MVCRMSGRLRWMHDAAPVSVSCLASRVACSVSLRTVRSNLNEPRYSLDRMCGGCILSTNNIRVCLMGPDQGPRHVKRVTGA